jgi:MraZ protein
LSNFLGQYLHAIDEKGRVPLPAKFRNGEDSAAEFVAVRGASGCLYLYPREAWGDVADRLTRLRRGGDLRKRREALAVTASAAELSLDKHGRLSLPQALLQVAGLEREALFVGAVDVIEIWDPARYEGYMKPDDLDYDRIAANVL